MLAKPRGKAKSSRFARQASGGALSPRQESPKRLWNARARISNPYFSNASARGRYAAIGAPARSAGLIYRCGSATEANTDQCDSSKLQPQPHSCNARPCAAPRWIGRGRGDAPHQSRLALDDHRSSTGRAKTRPRSAVEAVAHSSVVRLSEGTSTRHAATSRRGSLLEAADEDSRGPRPTCRTYAFVRLAGATSGARRASRRTRTTGT